MKEAKIYEINMFDIYSGVSRIYQTSNMEFFVTLVNSYKLLTTVKKSSVLDKGVSRYIWAYLITLQYLNGDVKDLKSLFIVTKNSSTIIWMVSIWDAFDLRYAFNTNLKTEKVARRNVALINVPQVTRNFFRLFFSLFLFLSATFTLIIIFFCLTFSGWNF